jgi:pimeloyl-ACP methyl ester carboxylesterase
LLAAAAFATLLCAQTPVPGPQILTFFSGIDDSDQPYALYLPANYSPDRRYPLVVSLHGAWSNHRLNLRRVFGQGNRPGESDASATRHFPKLPEVDFIVASPLARGTMGYQTIPEKDVYDVLADVKKRFSVDDDRVYLTGLSMGGGGTLWLGLTRPDIWAAIAPVCPYPPAGTEDLAGNALNVPVKLFQGEIDPVVPAAGTRQWHERLRSAGVAAEFVEYPGVRHNSWDNAYRDAAIFEWFSRHRRVRFPERVRFASRSYEYPTAYWVRLDRLTPGVLASIDARFEDKRLTVTTANLDGFTLHIEKHPSYRARMPVIIDGTKTQAPARGSISFRRTAKGWTAGEAKPGPQEKRAGLEGPIAAAFASRHVYVYGTTGADEAELARRRELAARAADWSSPRVKLQLTPRIASDRETDLAGANLVLLGSRGTNALIESMAAQLPLHVNPGAADYGMLYVYPVNGRYVIVSSGLPWWTRIDQVNRGGAPFLPELYRLLLSFGDFVVFRGGIDDIVAEGSFDRNWKLPPDAVEKLKATGAVEIRQ